MSKTIIIIALAFVNVTLILTKPSSSKTHDEIIIGLTVNRIFHEQINGTWPHSYGPTTKDVTRFDNEIIEASKQHITDWLQYRP